MVWVHTCEFPFNSELWGIRCGTHSTIRGVHTLFTPIDIQHAAAKGNLEGEGRSKGSVKGKRISHLCTLLSHLIKSYKTNSCFSCSMALSCNGSNNKRGEEWSEKTVTPPEHLIFTASRGLLSLVCHSMAGQTTYPPSSWGSVQTHCLSCMTKSNILQKEPAHINPTFDPNLSLKHPDFSDILILFPRGRKEWHKQDRRNIKKRPERQNWKKRYRSRCAWKERRKEGSRKGGRNNAHKTESNSKAMD